MTDESVRESAGVGIVIVNYNTSDQILACLESIDGLESYHIVIVDNCSPNDDLSLLSNLYPKIKVIYLPRNIGFGGGCNAGAEWIFCNTNCGYVLFLNPDTIVVADAINLMVDVLMNETIWAVVPKIITTSEPPVIWYGGGEFSWWKGGGSIRSYGKHLDDTEALIERDVSFATGCALMLSKNAYKITHGFDEKYFMYEEDVELSLRILSHGFRIRYLPLALIKHVGQGSQEMQARSIGMYHPNNPRLTFFVFYVCRNRIYTLIKHGDYINWVVFCVGFCLWLIKKMVHWAVFGRFDAIKAAFIGIANGFGWVMPCNQ